MPRRPSQPFVVRALLTLLTLMMSAAVLSCSSGSGTPALVAPGISTVVITAIGSNDRARAVVIQSDGKVVAAGSSSDGTKNVFALARYINDGLTDGVLDGSFGSGGTVTTVIGDNAQAQAAAIQPIDGYIVVAGYAYDSTANKNLFVVARYKSLTNDNTDGQLDTTFNGTGIVETSIDPLSVDDRAYAVAIQSDGGEDKLVVAGYSSVDTLAGVQSRVALARYHPDGSLDSGFGTGGKVTTSVPIAGSPDLSAQANGLAIQTNGQLVVAGVVDKVPVTNGSTTTTQDEFLVVRYNTDGSLDTTTFNVCPVTPTEPCNGMVATAIGTTANEHDEAFAVVIDGNNNLVVAGSSYASGQSVIALARYKSLTGDNTDGQLDTSFNATGKVTTAILTRAAAFALAIQADKIVVAGSAYNATYPEFVLARYTSTGGLDGTFGSGGKIDTKITYGSEAFGLVIQSGGKLIAAGYSQDASKNESFTLVRYSDTGVVDATFPPQP